MKTRILRTVVLLTLWCGWSAPVNTFGGGWGIERGRANEGDVGNLAADQIAIKRAEKRLSDALTRSLVIERQKQLLGMTDIEAQVSSMRMLELIQMTQEWMLTEVIEPAEAISMNPAASCAEANIAVQSLLGMMRQRQLLGMEPSPDNNSDYAQKLRDFDQNLQERADAARGKLATRCREEALDECIVTGRVDQIVQVGLGLARFDALMGGDGGDYLEWMEGALKQCAIYELHFVSTTKVPQIFNLEMVRDTKIKMEFDFTEGGVLNRNLRLKGESKGGTNPFFISVKC